MATAKWRPTSGAGAWSNASAWSPAAPVAGNDVIIGSSLDTGSVLVTEDVSLAVNTLTMAANTGASKSNTTTLTITPGAVLTVNGPISLGKNAIINGTGTFVANGAISGGGTIAASSGLLDLEGNGSIASGGAVLTIGTVTPSTLKLNLAGGVTASGVNFSSANQTLLIGPAEAVTFTTNEKVISGAIQMAGGTLTDSNGITLGSQALSGKLSGFGIVDAVLSKSGTGTANFAMASGGVLDLKRNVSGLGLAIDSSAPTRLLLEGTVSTPTAIALNSANQTLEIGAVGKLTIAAAESVSNAAVQLDGGAIVDSAGFTLGSGASLVGSGAVTGSISGTGMVKATGGDLDLLSGVTSTSTAFTIDTTSGSVLGLAGTAALGTVFRFAGPSGRLELKDIANGVVRQFNGTIAGLNVGTSATVPTNAVNIQTTVTSAMLSGSSISVLNGGTKVATLSLSSVPLAGAFAFVTPDAKLGGYDVFLAPAPPKITWSAATGNGVEGQAIALGTIAPTSGNPLQSVLVSGIAVGSKLSDGTKSFTASGGNTSVNILGWNYAALTLTPSNDLNASLTVQATDTGGNISAPATETVTVNPLAPGVAPAGVFGVQGHAIPLNLGLGVNGLSGDTNQLASVTLGSIPSGATLSNTNGNTLTISNGSITFTQPQLAAGVLNGLALTTAGAGTFSLTVSATEQDSEGNTSPTTTGVEAVTVATPPTVTWSAAAGSGVEGQAIALGTITPSSGNPLQSVLVSGIAVGSKLSDGTNSFTATSGNTSVNILGWNYSALSLTPSNDLNASLTVQVTDTANNASAPATETVTVNPLAPGVAPAGVSGVQGHAIPLNLGLGVNGLSGDANTLASVTISSIPSGATLSNTNGNTLTLSNGSITFTATQLAAGVLNGLALTTIGAGIFNLTVSATEQDSEGNTSTTAIGVEALTVTPAPTVIWSAAVGSGVEGEAIALGTITPNSGNPLQSVLVSGIAVGSKLNDGTNSFTASSGNTSVNILGWNYSALSLTPGNDLNASLTVQVTDTANNASAPATETVTVNPLAPGVTPAGVSGAQGQPIALNLGLGVNGLNGDTNTLASVTISSIPSGATLSNTNGNTLTISNGSITFTQAQLAAGVLNGLALTTAGAGTFSLTVSATEQDSEANASTTAIGVEALQVTPASAPTVTWSAASGSGVEGQAIALGAITPTSSGNPLQSVLVSGIAVGSKLSDGTDSFTATSGSTSVNILGWNYSALSLTPSNDLNASLTVQVTDTANNASAPVTETVTVNPLAPGVTPAGVSGVQGQPIALNLGLGVNGLSGDTNTLASVTISSIPSGAALSNTNGNTLTISNGSITFTQAQLAAGVLNGLALTTVGAGTFNLVVAATEQDSEGNVSATVSATEQVAAAAPTAIPTYSHIVVVFEDSQPYLYNRFNYPQGIVSNPTATYINGTLIPGGALLTNYIGVSYPGEPNYLAAYAGSTFGIADNGSYTLSGPTLDTILAAGGKTFTGYVEQQNGPQDPWLSFPEANTVQQNFSAFPSSNFANLPTVSFVMPNLNNDMDNGTVGQGDTWLRNNLGAYAQWALDNNSLLIVTTTDDGDRSQNNKVATVLYGANVTPGTSSTSYNAYNLLNTLLAGYGLTAPNNAAGVPPIQVFNTSTGTGATPSVSWSTATVSGPEAQELVPGTITPSSIALGTLTLNSANPVQSVLVSGIPVGATLTDGAHSFTAQLGSTAANILGWNYSGLSIAPIDDGNISLIAQVTDTAGNKSAVAIESVTVTPLAPTVTPLVATGVEGQPIGLIPGVSPNGVNGETNSLYSLTLTGVPSGATLSNAKGDTLTVNNNSITFNATQLAGGVLNGLALTIGNPGSYQLGVSAIAQDAEGNLSASASSTETVTALSPLPVHTYSHIVVVVEENRNYSDIVGSSTAPYINNTLIAGGALLTNFWAPTHPSEPDHLALYAGSTFGVTDNGVNSLPDPTLYTALASAGKTFVGYAEQPYSWGLEPWQNFPEGNSVQQDFSAFPQGNFASLPTVSFVIPNLGDNMHNGTVDEGDTWLQNNLGSYAQWAANPANNSLLIVTWDENGAEVPAAPNQVAGIFYGAGVVPGTNGTPYNFYNLLNTLVDGYGAAGPGYASQQGPIQVFDPPPSNNVFTLTTANSSLVLSGSSNMVFLNGATAASITDDPTGVDHLKLVVEPAGGSVSITNFSVAAGAEVDLPLGFGGFASSSQVLAALQPDQTGGTLLQVGGQLSVDFIHVLPSAFQNANIGFT